MNNIDRFYTKDPSKFARSYLNYVKEVIDNIDVREVSEFITALVEAREKGRTIYFLGNVDTNLAVTVGIALFSVVVLASLMGTITPLVLDRFGINPAVASGPFITTTNDLLGILVYFSVAYSLLP